MMRFFRSSSVVIYGASFTICLYAVGVRSGGTSLLNQILHQSTQNACSCSVSVIFGGSSGITGGFLTPFGRSGTVLRRPDACAVVAPDAALPAGGKSACASSESREGEAAMAWSLVVPRRPK